MAEWPYSSAQWQRLRLAKLAENPVCTPCDRQGRVTPASHVDHVKNIASGGEPFPPLDGLMSMCASCHSIKTWARDRRGGSGVAIPGCGLDGLPIDPAHPSLTGLEPPRFNVVAQERALPLGMRPSRIPLVIVCGPPGSGKSTYVATHAGDNDLVIDLDVIRSRLSGLPIHADANRWTGRALDERNRILRSLAINRRNDRAWFIFGGARRAARDHWRNMLQAERVHMIDTALPEIERRIWADPTRGGREGLMVEWARRWFAEYEP